MIKRLMPLECSSDCSCLWLWENYPFVALEGSGGSSSKVFRFINVKKNTKEAEACFCRAKGASPLLLQRGLFIFFYNWR